MINNFKSVEPDQVKDFISGSLIRSTYNLLSSLTNHNYKKI